MPEDYYISSLTPGHAPIINEVWPHNHPGSEIYVSQLIEANGGVGLFAKSTHELCAWVLKTYFGSLGLLQVAEAHKRKGFGSLMTKIFSKKLAEDGLDVTGTVVIHNVASQMLFKKLGFKRTITVTWLVDYQDKTAQEYLFPDKI